jgi:predicted kinase
LLLRAICVTSLNMRKWMRERLQRRKKKTVEQAEQPAPPPLQPAYFDEASAGQAAHPDEPQIEAPLRDEVESAEVDSQGSGGEEAAGEMQPASAESRVSQSGGRARQTPAGGQSPRGRSRRRRGGRGRGGRGRESAVAQAFAPGAAKGLATELQPAESADAAEPEADSPAPAPQASKGPAAVPAASARPPKGIVVLAIGLPGSGKSSWFKRHSVVPLSSDMVRSLLFDDIREQRFQDLVFSNLRSMLKARLIAKRPMNYVDATNLTPQERQHWIKLAKDYNYEVHAVFFDVPLEVCLERHQRRDRVVPEDVMRRMAAKLKPPTFPEGFAKITVVRVKKKEA